MRVKSLEELDTLYHSYGMPWYGFIVCDLYDWRCGVRAGQLVRERCRKIIAGVTHTCGGTGRFE